MHCTGSSITFTVRNTYMGSVCPLGTADQVTSEGGTAILLPLGVYGGYTPTMPPWGIPNPLVDNLGADAN